MSREKIPWQKPSKLQPSKFICDGLKLAGQPHSFWVYRCLQPFFLFDFASFAHFWGLERWGYWFVYMILYAVWMNLIMHIVIVMVESG